MIPFPTSFLNCPQIQPVTSKCSLVNSNLYLLFLLIVVNITVANMATSDAPTPCPRPSWQANCYDIFGQPGGCSSQSTAVSPINYPAKHWKFFDYRHTPMIVINNRPTARRICFLHRNYGILPTYPGTFCCTCDRRRRRARPGHAWIGSACNSSSNGWMDCATHPPDSSWAVAASPGRSTWIASPRADSEKSASTSTSYHYSDCSSILSRIPADPGNSSPSN